MRASRTSGQVAPIVPLRSAGLPGEKEARRPLVETDKNPLLFAVHKPRLVVCTSPRRGVERTMFAVNLGATAPGASGILLPIAAARFSYRQTEQDAAARAPLSLKDFSRAQ
jgi:hypothetical protein